MVPVQVIIDPYSKKIETFKGKSLLELILSLNKDINVSCGGNGTCGKCLIQNLSPKDSLNKLTEREKEVLTSEEIGDGYRLACQCTIQSDLYIRMTEKILGYPFKKAQILSTQNEDFIKKPIVNRLKARTTNMDMEYGIAFDLGTTTIVGYLVDLQSGNIISTDSMFNPQIIIGEDVISRIAFAEKSKANTLQMQKLIKNAFNRIMSNLLESQKIPGKLISEIIVVGNTAMHHLFFAFPVRTLGRSPYLPAISTALSINNEELALDMIAPTVKIYSPPIIAGFVGGDTIADIIAVRQDQLPMNVLMVDIGTNGELTLGGRKGILAASVAAGPAFEGAQITFGMRGETGAIERVKIDPITLIPEIEVIGDTTPIGLCGSAIIDIVAEMLRSTIITRSGNFNKKLRDNPNYPRIRKGKTGYEYLIHSSKFPATYKFTRSNSAESTLPNFELYITQGDIREIQKAKGAFLSGALVLLQEKSLISTDLDQIFIAGAFGSYLHKENAKFIGLIPELRLDLIHQLGNAAGAGAVNLLVNNDLKNIANNIAKEVKYIELANSPQFPRIFAESMIFPHKNLKLFPSLKEEYQNLPYR